MTEQKYPALEMPAADKHGHGAKTRTYYKIEARNNSATPKVIDPNGPFPFVLDNYWAGRPTSAAQAGCCASRRDWWRLNSTRAIAPRRLASRQFRSVHSSRHLFTAERFHGGGGAMS